MARNEIALHWQNYYSIIENYDEKKQADLCFAEINKGDNEIVKLRAV
jgi:hypothetical protein